MFRKILVVCLGNICRSPVGEGLFKNYFLNNGFSSEYQVSSAGIEAVVGSGPSPHSVEVLQDRGIDISGHIAQQLTFDMMLENDLILVMEKEQKKFLEKKFPFAHGKVQLFGKFLNDKEIKDPYLKPLFAFESMLIDLENSLQGWHEHCFVNLKNK